MLGVVALIIVPARLTVSVLRTACSRLAPYAAPKSQRRTGDPRDSGAYILPYHTWATINRRTPTTEGAEIAECAHAAQSSGLAKGI